MNLPNSPFLYPILDSAFSDDLSRDVRTLLRAGVRILQIRAKDFTKFRVFEIAEELAPACEQAEALLIINDLVDVTLVSSAAGVHLGQEDFPVTDARKILSGKIIGLSTHNLQQFSVALSLPVSYIAIGPVYQTATKPAAGRTLGVEFLRKVRPLTKTPLVCIGGITEDRIPELVGSGADGIAVISALFSALTLYDSVSRLLERVRR